MSLTDLQPVEILGIYVFCNIYYLIYYFRWFVGYTQFRFCIYDLNVCIFKIYKKSKIYIAIILKSLYFCCCCLVVLLLRSNRTCVSLLPQDIWLFKDLISPLLYIIDHIIGFLILNDNHWSLINYVFRVLLKKCKTLVHQV